MDKPFAIAYRDTRDAIVDTLNNSGLPLDVLDMLLVQIQSVVHAQAEQEYQKLKESDNGTTES